jgi:hypothetical protein
MLCVAFLCKKGVLGYAVALFGVTGLFASSGSTKN